MSVITLPDGGNFAEWTLPVPAAYAIQSPYTGKTTAADTGAALTGWTVTLDIAPTANINAWRSWMAQMRGPVNFTDVPAVQSEQVAQDFAYYQSVSANGAQLVNFGVANPGITPGMLITVYTGATQTKPRMVTITSATVTDGNGSTIITWTPSVPTGAISGFVLRQPFCRMRLAPPYNVGYGAAMANIHQPREVQLEEVYE
jgi:hypothetical protein